MRVIIELRDRDGVTRVERDIKHDQYQLEEPTKEQVRSGVFRAATEALSGAGYPEDHS